MIGLIIENGCQADPTLIGQSSYGGKFGIRSAKLHGKCSHQQAYTAVVAHQRKFLTDFLIQYRTILYTAPNAGYYAEEGSDWRRGRPTEAYNLPIVA